MACAPCTQTRDAPTSTPSSPPSSRHVAVGDQVFLLPSAGSPAPAVTSTSAVFAVPDVSVPSEYADGQELIAMDFRLPVGGMYLLFGSLHGQVANADGPMRLSARLDCGGIVQGSEVAIVDVKEVTAAGPAFGSSTFLTVFYAHSPGRVELRAWRIGVPSARMLAALTASHVGYVRLG